jgi:hypothetical protein
MEKPKKMATFALKLKKTEIFFKTSWNIKNNICIFALAFENRVKYI